MNNYRNWILIVVIVYFLQLILREPQLLIFIGLGMTYWVLSRQRFLKIHRKILIPALGAISVPLFVNFWAEPSSALFLKELQSAFFDDILGFFLGNDHPWIFFLNLFCNTLRLGYVIFCLVVGGFAIRDHLDGEEMSKLTQLTLRSLVGIFILDIILSLIIS